MLPVTLGPVYLKKGTVKKERGKIAWFLHAALECFLFLAVQKEEVTLPRNFELFIKLCYNTVSVVTERLGTRVSEEH